MRDDKRSPRAALLLAALFALTVTGQAALAQQAAGAKAPRSAAAQRAVKRYTIEQFMDTTRVGGANFSDDEKQLLFHSNKTGIFNVYTVPVARS